MISFFFPSKKPKPDEKEAESDTQSEIVPDVAEIEQEKVPESVAQEDETQTESANQKDEELVDAVDEDPAQPTKDSTEEGPIVVHENLDDDAETASSENSANDQAKLNESDQKAALEAEKLTQKKTKSSEPETAFTFDTIKFYRQPIRKVYFNKHWYFFLEDIISLTGTIDLLPFIARLKKNPEYQKHEAKYIQSISIQVNGKEELVECVNAKGCLWLIPILRPFERFFPGPFPTWIETISAVH